MIKARDIFWVIAAMLIAVVLAYVLIVATHEAQGQRGEPQLYQGIPVDAHLLELDKRALSEAYHAQVLKLWAVLLADGARDTAPFTRGMANLRRAYGLATAQIEQREQQLERKQ
jgi:hypothetical protein